MNCVGYTILLEAHKKYFQYFQNQNKILRKCFNLQYSVLIFLSLQSCDVISTKASRAQGSFNEADARFVRQDKIFQMARWVNSKNWILQIQQNFLKFKFENKQ